MKLAELKSEFHTLIDKIENPGVLEQFYNGLNNSIKPDNSLWSSLTLKQQEEVLLAYEESEDETNLISLSSIKSKFIG
jgi:hypothetical protein